MKRPKSLPSRRQRALRRMGVLLLFLLLLPALYQPSFTPRQVIRASENLLGLERTEVVGQTELLSHQVTFSANEDVLLVTVFQPLRPLGPSMDWIHTQVALDAPTDRQPCSLTLRSVWYQEAEASAFLVFGQTCLEGARWVRIYNHPASWSYDPNVYLEGEFFSTSTGQGYCFQQFASPDNNFVPKWYQVLDRAGNVLYTAPLPDVYTQHWTL